MTSKNSPSTLLKLASFAFALLGLAVVTIPAQAGTVINWNGSTSVTWATGANWDLGVAPANDFTATGDTARFNLASYNGTVGPAPFSPNAGTTGILGLQIGSSSGALTIATTNLSIGASGINMESGAAATSIAKVTAAVAQTWTNNSANTLTFTGANVYTGRVTLNAGAMTFNGAGTGAGGVTIDGAAALTSQANAFGTGTLILNAGSLNVNANRDQANTLSITGDFTFRTEGNGPTYSGLKSTTGNRIITFQEGPAGTSATGNAISFTVNPIVLGGDLELNVMDGGTTGIIVVKPVISGGLDLNGANRILTLSAPSTLTIGVITLSGDLTITGSGAGATALNGGFNTAGVNRTITFNNSGGVPTLSGAPTGAASTVTLDGSSTNAVIGALTGATAHGFNVNSTTGGLFKFSGASTFTGGVTVTSGIAQATVAGVAATSGPLGTGATIVNGGRLDSTLANALLGSSSITVNGGELRATAGNSLNTNAVPITLSGGTLGGFNAATINYGTAAINVTANSTIINQRSSTGAAINETFGSSVSVGNSQLTVTSNDNFSSGAIATVTLGAGTLTGNGILNVTKNPSTLDSTVLALTTLGVTGTGNAIAASNGSTTVSGATTIGGGSAGALAVNGALTATGGVSIAANGSLGGSGTITGTVTTVANTSAIAPGNSPGTLSITGALNLANGGTFNLELGSTSGAPNSDLLAVSGALTGSTNPNDLIFNFTSIGGGTAAGTPYTLITYGSMTGLDSTDILTNTLPTGLILDSSFGTNGYLITATDLEVQFAPNIPEPSTWALMLSGFGMLVGVQRMRRRS